MSWKKSKSVNIRVACPPHCLFKALLIWFELDLENTFLMMVSIF